MRKYYLVSEKEATGGIRVFVSDNAGVGRTVLMELEAESFAEASKQVKFSCRGMGETAWCGVAVNGMPYHGGSKA